MAFRRQAHLALAVAAILFSGITTLRAAAPYALPPELQAARDAATMAQAGIMQRTLGEWETAEILPTSTDKAADHWSSTTGTITSGNEGLCLSVPEGPIFASYKDKTFGGPIGLMYKARTAPNAKASDLSCKVTADGQGAQLVFGGYGNTGTHLNIYDGPNGTTITPIKTEGAPLITPDTWHTVILLIGKDRVNTFVDGISAGEAPTPAGLADKPNFTVELYVADTSGLFKEVTVLRPRKAGGTPISTALDEATMKKYVETAAKYLGDSNYEARQTAFDVLWALRPLSQETIEKLAKSDDPEIHGRAAELLGRMTTPARTNPNLPRRRTTVVPNPRLQVLPR